MPINHAALKTELQTDPSGLGYASLLAAGNNEAVAALMNQPTNTDVDRRVISTHKLSELIVAADYTALSVVERDRLRLLLSFPTIDLQNANIRANLGAVFGAATPTRAAILAFFVRKGTLAEVLFGEGTVITWQDVAKALGV